MQHFDDSGHSFAKIAIPYTIYTSSSIYLPSYQSALFCGLASWIYIAAIYYCDAPASLLFYKNSKILIQWTNIRKN